MGTSQSSKGPGPGVPMVPPWAPDLPSTNSSGDDQSQDSQDSSAAPSGGVPIAPSGRFGGARRSLGGYAGSGGRSDLRQGLKHYIRSGYGGSKTATRRFAGTASTAAVLGGVLAGLASGQSFVANNGLDPVLLAGKSADEVMSAVTEAVRPVDGTQDAEAQRAAIRDSLSEVLTRFPDADLVNLNPEHREFAIETFTAFDVVHRFELDVGKTIFAKSPNATAALARLKEAREYIKETVSAAFRKLKETGKTLTTGQIKHVVKDALQETFEVFEGYIK
ncbi:Qat anti-phage system associated protein QatB [Cellvibrio fibrivorans]|uniref:Uncharacterized protein n=1 Tax=Cellvibrio fibrivorans TaxID=126350 RepID=A0ABU1UXX7_9GAMM|nr:Qat anti-phage system associated protein QatB [Cellvibrio fibrivorans]MDR7089953.1 hypothetical protein [Cellvibrio fibrivorans]